jgi:4-amino-4-deoxy-L-arabinose transferase-like glycosyltransferase
VIGAIGAVLATLWVAGMFVSRRAAVLAALMMAASIMLGVEARLAKTDAMLLFAVVLCMGVLARAYLPRPDGERSCASVMGTLPFDLLDLRSRSGVLLKGPLILMFVGLAMAGLADRNRSVGGLAEGGCAR